MIDITWGDSPLVLGLPHTGTDIPDDCLAPLNETGRAIADTDWHIDRLYSGLLEGASAVRTTVHRYVIDVNRDPSGQSLYPGQNTTGLCPLTDFDGQPIYADGQEPDAEEVERRRLAYHAPYHDALAAELDRIRAIHGFAVLYDCHSIRSRIPFLFDGPLPDFNIGTNLGATCDPQIEASVQRICEAADGYSSIVNGRFKGGWTTRHYGRPGEGLHAIQMELAQSTYLSAETPPWTYDDTRADRLRVHLANILETLSAWRPK
ncbi:N-formylglutamate deformylase [Lutimaribacter sp. EGI FJ00015]|uniref:N-formylglutamate deformylase n=1 Tax=Lutimaribacter degradans TaxID=2945989 RepID=A0ACC5ZYJ4_9RHOB|nr:N-formylglutamate deformylase [Lutimaribacter sp. EGI FJ00013]MCM2563372.1 N-formylglutamate deformylase [Lutimaribacter sp. EGI FJ00013]MCO0614549.1 N-formylglutamate deformylase [Lutimaribacter sp. EGI FJ00015]MCO0637222.1 N-formylglutamate deformylase [Lutimaribacter sp. EGI FJ00014]